MTYFGCTTRQLSYHESPLFFLFCGGWGDLRTMFVIVAGMLLLNLFSKCVQIYTRWRYERLHYTQEIKVSRFRGHNIMRNRAVAVGSGVFLPHRLLDVEVFYWPFLSTYFHLLTEDKNILRMSHLGMMFRKTNCCKTNHNLSPKMTLLTESVYEFISSTTYFKSGQVKNLFSGPRL